MKIAITLVLGALIAGVTPVLASGTGKSSQTLPGYTGNIQNRVLRDTAGGQSSSFIIELSKQADLSRAYAMKDQNARGWYVYRTLKRTAAETQGPLIAMLKSQGVSYRSFWVANEIVVNSGGRALVDSLAARPDVSVIEANDASNWLLTTDNYDFGDSVALLKQGQPHTVEPGPAQVHAPAMWTLGYTGTGIVVGNQDTGMRWTHNALKPHYRGWNGSSADHNYNWHDSIHADISGNGTNPCGFNTVAPCDDQGHGTQTTGLATADDEAGNKIGVPTCPEWRTGHSMHTDSCSSATPTQRTLCSTHRT